MENNTDYTEERDCFEKSFQRPKNYFKLSARRQWEIDDEFGILDWKGKYLTENDNLRFKNHYQ